ncbi:hypothetical protein FBY06_10367 [Pseudomonas sp. SJZ085]|nr:hypothetical protein FBX99_102308 [Pseudomonas sp. SJZ074]TWC40885.1 hypothetical protein FBY06_10367 [Pseudomonas sp. SJZ085]
MAPSRSRFYEASGLIKSVERKANGYRDYAPDTEWMLEIITGAQAQGEARDGRTLAREAYFVEFARDIQTVAKMPVMVTGGIRRPVAERVVQSGVNMVGIGTALANMAVVKYQLGKLSRAKKPDPRISPLRALILQQVAMGFRTRQYRRWVEKGSM